MVKSTQELSEHSVIPLNLNGWFPKEKISVI